jgi:aminoglycoside 2'-N-acetyltransferase I
MPMTDLAVNRVDSVSTPPSARREIIRLYNLAYDEELNALFDAFGPAGHVTGRVDDQLVSDAMWVTRWLQVADLKPLRTVYVEGVATHPAYQRRGFASQIVQRLASEIERYDIGALCPKTDVLPLYQRLGWGIWRGPLAIRSKDGPPSPRPHRRVGGRSGRVSSVCHHQDRRFGEGFDRAVCLSDHGLAWGVLALKVIYFSSLGVSPRFNTVFRRSQ